MADLDDIRDGDNFGLNSPADTSKFYLKGMNSMSWGIKNRMSRIFNRKSGRTVMLAFDHGFLMGPTSGLERIDLNIAPLGEHADCLMGCRGSIRTMIPPENTKPVCLRADTGTTILTELNHNVLLGEEEMLSMLNFNFTTVVEISFRCTQLVDNLVKNFRVYISLDKLIISDAGNCFPFVTAKYVLRLNQTNDQRARRPNRFHIVAEHCTTCRGGRFSTKMKTNPP